MTAPATAAIVLLGLVLPPALGAEDGSDPVPATADIELRKNFRSVPRAGRRPSRPEGRGAPGASPTAPEGGPGFTSRQIGAAAAASGERLLSSGTLFLPGVGAGGIALSAAATPLLETAAGRRVIIDTAGTIASGDSAAIERLWPGFTVLHPPAGADLRELTGSLLDAAGYHAVLRATPLTFGRGVTVRLSPDFVVLRGEQDLLEGEVRAISVVEPADAVPAELRELAGKLRISIVEMTGDGSPAGPDSAPPRDPTGRVTTMETARLAHLLEEISCALGFVVERGASAHDTGGAAAGAALRIRYRDQTALVIESPDPAASERPADPGEGAIVLAASADPTVAIGALLKRFGVAAVGPGVELYRASKQGGGRFVIRAPGWLAESAGRRLLITGASPAPLIRLFLTREGVDIFEYRLRR